MPRTKEEILADLEHAEKHNIHEHLRKLSAAMRAAGCFPVTDETVNELKLELASLEENRKTAAKRWCEKHGRKKADLYRQAGVDKADYYRWERGELPDGNAQDTNLRRVLNS
jgi:hypothetical protein